LSTLCTTILLCPPESAQTLRDNFPVHRFKRAPDINIQELFDIYEQKLVEAKMPANPLPVVGLRIIAEATRYNVVSFMAILASIIEDIPEDITETVPLEYVIEQLKGQIDKPQAFKLVIHSLSGAYSPTQIADIVSKVCRQEINAREAGLAIRSILGITSNDDPRVKRTADGIVYLLNKDKIQLPPTA